MMDAKSTDIFIKRLQALCGTDTLVEVECVFEQVSSIEGTWWR